MLESSSSYRGLTSRRPPADDGSMAKDRKLVLVLLANVAMVVALVIVGLASHSLGVLAAGGDYLGDAAGVAFSLAALRLSRHARGHQSTCALIRCAG
jgi:Co/Zn/Cd efflux system component